MKSLIEMKFGMGVRTVEDWIQNLGQEVYKGFNFWDQEIRTKFWLSTKGLPNAEGFENSASASTAEGFKILGQRLGRTFDIQI